MRKTNAEISLLLQKAVRDGKAKGSDKHLLSEAERLSQKYMMRHIMESARGVFTDEAWEDAFSRVRTSQHARLAEVMGTFNLQKRFWRMAQDVYNTYHDNAPHSPPALSPLISRAYDSAYKVLLSPAANGRRRMRPAYDWNLYVVAGCRTNKTWRILTQIRELNRWDEKSLPMDSTIHVSGFHLGINGQEIADGDILLALTCPQTSEFEGQTRLLKLPISWGIQVERLGTATIGNRIVKRAKYLGMFGDVEGYQVTLYGRGVKPTDFTEEDVYVGKLGDTIQICKSRMYIKSVTRRKVGAEVGAELLSSFA